MTRKSWGYAADNGPSCWASLDPAFRLCGCGAEQSPIDLVNASVANVPPIRFGYGPVRAAVENTGRTIQFNSGPGLILLVGGHRFELKQFHFHHASEHLVDGTTWPMELHLVHADSTGRLAVVGVLIGEGEANPAADLLWQALVDEPESLGHVDVDPSPLLPPTTRAWRYQGSLTTPPCSEGVTWIVLVDAITLSAPQIAAFANFHPPNCRPVQPLGRRALVIG